MNQLSTKSTQRSSSSNRAALILGIALITANLAALRPYVFRVSQIRTISFGNNNLELEKMRGAT